MMLAMYTTYWLFTLFKVDPYLSIVLTGPAFFLLGMLIQRVVIEPNRFAAEHNQLLLTLGLALFLENLALVLWQGDFRTVRPAYASASFVVGEALVEVPRLVACGGAIVMAVVLFAFLKLTDVGKAIRALAEEPEGAMLMGINVSRIRAAAFGIGAGAVAVAGALVTPFFYVAPDVGESFNIMAFVVVVLGGMGNFVGALLGGFIVGLAESLGATLLPGSLKQLVVFALFVLVLLFRPAGLFGGGRGRLPIPGGAAPPLPDSPHLPTAPPPPPPPSADWAAKPWARSGWPSRLRWGSSESLASSVESHGTRPRARRRRPRRPSAVLAAVFPRDPDQRDAVRLPRRRLEHPRWVRR